MHWLSEEKRNNGLQSTTKTKKRKTNTNNKCLKAAIVTGFVALFMVVVFRGEQLDNIKKTLNTRSTASVSTTPATALPNTMISPIMCTPTQMSAIENSVKMVLLESACPQYYSSAVDTGGDYKDQNERFVGINVGCNKGIDAVDIGRYLSKDSVFDRNAWMRELGKFAGVDDSSCGRQKDQLVVSNNDLKNKKKRTGHVHCIEPMPGTVDMLKQVASATSLDKHGLILTQAAMSNQTGSVLFQGTNARLGIEVRSMMNDCNKPNARGCISVPMFSLDDYVEKYVDEKDLDIEILLVDVEGFDFDVLHGGRKTLKRVRYLEFEVNVMGSWVKQRAVDAVDYLEDFTCYWAGRGHLLRISNCTRGSKLPDLYQKGKKWSNIACVRNDQHRLKEIMERIFLETIRSQD